jgi:hypothetical protein
LWWFGAGEAITDRGDWKEEWLVPHSLGGRQKIAKEEGGPDIEKREGSGSSKSHTPIEKGMAIERIERTTEDLRKANKKGQNWIPIR